MKHFSAIILACALAIPAFAQDAKTKSADAAAQAPGQTLAASAAVLTAPIVLTNDAIVLIGDAMAEGTNGGSAVFTFTITEAGSYVFEALVNAADDNSNSFLANVDDQPTDPDMIWDVDVTMGFEKRVLSWRGTGDASSEQFAPKRFTLTAGTHKLILNGREPDTQLKSLTIRPAPAQ